MTADANDADRRDVPADALAPGSSAPRTADERDALLRRVPDFVVLPELRGLFFPQHEATTDATSHPARIAALADAAYLGRLRVAVSAVEARAIAEENGGLRFLAASLGHFVSALPPARHPLIVALYFASAVESPAEHLDEVAHRMDEYESLLPLLAVDDSAVHK